MERSLDIMRQRVNAFGVSETELQRTGRDQIEVNLPGVSDAERAARQVGSTAQLFFYDWEANVLDADCRTNPEQKEAPRATRERPGVRVAQGRARRPAARAARRRADRRGAGRRARHPRR